MTGLELITASAYSASPLVCVLRDGELSQISQFQKMMVNRVASSVLPEYDLIAVFTGWNIYDTPALDGGYALGRLLEAVPPESE